MKTSLYLNGFLNVPFIISCVGLKCEAQPALDPSPCYRISKCLPADSEVLRVLLLVHHPYKSGFLEAQCICDFDAKPSASAESVCLSKILPG